MQHRSLHASKAISPVTTELQALCARTANTSTPLDDAAFSRLEKTMDHLHAQIADRREKTRPIANPDQAQPYTHAPAVVAALAAHIDEFPSQRSVGLRGENRALFGRIMQELTAQLGLAAFKCPRRHLHVEPDVTQCLRKHIEENVIGTGVAAAADTKDGGAVKFSHTNLRHRTVIPEWITPGGRKSMYVDIDPGCVGDHGERQLFRLEELLPLGSQTPVTLKEAAALTGYSYQSIYMAAARTKSPLTQQGGRNGAGRKSATFWIGDILAIPTIAKSLPAGASDEP